jgi:cytochrome c553
MNRFARTSGIRRLALAAVLAAAALPLAATPQADQRGSRGTQAAEQTLEATLATCFSCHGPNGTVPLQPDYPILGGQHQYYIYQQLKDYAPHPVTDRVLRQHEVMTPIASALSKARKMEVAKWFSERPWPSNERDADPANIARGKGIATSGQCVQCHLGGFLGASGVPRLAGQQYEYLKAQMLAFKYKRRTNAAAKNSLFADFSDEDIEAMADYLSAMDSGQLRR